MQCSCTYDEYDSIVGESHLCQLCTKQKAITPMQISNQSPKLDVLTVQYDDTILNRASNIRLTNLPYYLSIISLNVLNALNKYSGYIQVRNHKNYKNCANSKNYKIVPSHLISLINNYNYNVLWNMRGTPVYSAYISLRCIWVSNNKRMQILNLYSDYFPCNDIFRDKSVIQPMHKFALNYDNLPRLMRKQSEPGITAYYGYNMRNMPLQYNTAAADAVHERIYGNEQY